MDLYSYLAGLFGDGRQASYPEWYQEQMQAPQKKTRPILMTYDQYKQDYMPLWDLYDKYTEHVEPIRNSDWRDNDPTYRYLKEVKGKNEFDNQMRKRQ